MKFQFYPYLGLNITSKALIHNLCLIFPFYPYLRLDITSEENEEITGVTEEGEGKEDEEPNGVWEREMEEEWKSGVGGGEGGWECRWQKTGEH